MLCTQPLSEIGLESALLDKMSLVDVCRLCLTKSNLVWVFDRRFENSENMKDVIYITTGVLIELNDIISQKICQKCCQVTAKMFEFRKTSAKNDQYLRAECREFLQENEIKILDTKTIKNEPGPEIKMEPKRIHSIHPTVRDIFKEYPQIKLPSLCLSSHITPFVSMPLDAVENYFKVHNLNFAEQTKHALRYQRYASKKTAPSWKLKISNNSPGNSRTSVTSKSAKHKKVDKLSDNRPETTPELIVCSPDIDTSKVDANNVVLVSDSDTSPPTRKRKISVLETPEKDTHAKTSNVVGPKVMNSPTSELSYVATKTAPLHICKLCNSVQYNAKDLRKHEMKHLRCQFCKKSCTSFQNKREHIENDCVIKKTMNNLPKILLEKVEQDVAVRRRYPEAFLDFAPLPIEYANVEAPMNFNLQSLLESPAVDNTSSESILVTDNDVTNSILAEANITNRIEVIEINDDDDDAEQHILGASPCVSSALAPYPPQVPPLASSENLVSVSVVKPDIKVRGGPNVLENVDPKTSDIKVLRELLTTYRQMTVSAEKKIQTDLLNDQTISVNRLDMTARCPYLKNQLYAYKVPIVIKNGTFNVTYNYLTPAKTSKKLCLWNDLTPVDIKSVNVIDSVRNEQVTSDNKNQPDLRILPSTATFNSPGTWSTAQTNYNCASVSFATKNENIINNPLLNNILEAESSATSTSVAAPDPILTRPEACLSPDSAAVGAIRVKNVWELT